MRKLQAAVVAILLFGAASLASAQNPQGQPGQGRGPAGGRQVSMLMQNITLTAEQQSKVDSITARYAAQRQELMADQSMEMEARRGKMRELMTKQLDEIKAVLTDEQKKVLEKNQADMMQQGGARRPPPAR
jgi:Spy/CpxP family protein refolding chaperone